MDQWIIAQKYVPVWENVQDTLTAPQFVGEYFQEDPITVVNIKFPWYVSGLLYLLIVELWKSN